MKVHFPYKFESESEKHQREIREFQSLPLEERWKRIFGLASLARYLSHVSENREMIRSQIEKSEMDWQIANRKLIDRYGRKEA